MGLMQLSPNDRRCEAQRLCDCANACQTWLGESHKNRGDSEMASLMRALQSHRAVTSVGGQWALMQIWWKTLHRDTSTTPERVTNQRCSVVNEALKVIAESAQKSSARLGDVARAVGVSYHYLEHLLKRYTGESFSHHLRLARIRISTELLANPHLSVKEIAFMSGFSRVSSFDRAFKRIHACRPSEWRSASALGGGHNQRPSTSRHLGTSSTKYTPVR